MVGKANHVDTLSLLCERKVKYLWCFHGIITINHVEVARTKEKHRIGMLCLHRVVLFQHRWCSIFFCRKRLLFLAGRLCESLNILGSVIRQSISLDVLFYILFSDFAVHLIGAANRIVIDHSIVLVFFHQVVAPILQRRFEGTVKFYGIALIVVGSFFEKFVDMTFPVQVA